MRYTCCWNFFHGSVRQASLAGSFSCGAFLSAILLGPLSSIQQCLRLHILRLSRRRWLLRQSLQQGALAGAYSQHRPSARASLWLLRSNSLFCVTVGCALSTVHLVRMGWASVSNLSHGRHR